MTAVNSPRVSSSVALVACAASFVMTLAACGSDTDTSSASTPSVADVVTSSVTETATAASACPTAAPAERWHTRVDAARDHRQRRGHRIHGYDGAARQGDRTVQRD